MKAEKAIEAQGRKTVLVVEDSPVQVLALVKLLESKNLNVICASNGQAGVLMAREYLPDLIILDVQMPEMDGLEACKIIKNDAATTHIPVILFTAHTQADIFLAGIQEGALDFVPKDAFSEVVLLRTLQQLNFILPEDAGEETSQAS